MSNFDIQYPRVFVRVRKYFHTFALLRNQLHIDESVFALSSLENVVVFNEERTYRTTLFLV